MTNFRKQLGYVLENKNLCVNGYTENNILFQNNDGKIDKQRKAKLYENKKGTYFNFESKRIYVSINTEVNETSKTNEVTVNESTELSEMIGDVGTLIAGLQTTNSNKTLAETNKKKYVPQSNFAIWIDNLVKTEIKKQVDIEHEKVISLLRYHSDLIETVRNLTKETFLKVFGAENLKCKTVNVDKVFGDSIVSKYSFLAKENGFNSNDVDRLIQAIIYKVLQDNSRLQVV